MALITKEAFKQKAKLAADKAAELSKKAGVSVKATIAQAQTAIEQKKQEQQLLRQPQPGGIARYMLNYKGGIPRYPRNKEVAKQPHILMDVMPDGFVFLSKGKSDGWFSGFAIAYDRVVEMEVTERVVSTAESLVNVGYEGLDFHQKNMLQITYLDEDGEEYIMRCEMVTGGTVMGQARVCLELMDTLRTHKIIKRFLGRSVRERLPVSQVMDVPEQLQKFKNLLDLGVITQEEFDKKKKQLLEL